jgi:hypothetical protein
MDKILMNPAVIAGDAWPQGEEINIKTSNGVLNQKNYLSPE